MWVLLIAALHNPDHRPHKHVPPPHLPSMVAPAPLATAQPTPAQHSPTEAPQANGDAPKPMVAPIIIATVEPSTAEVGDTIVLRVTVKHAEADTFEFPNDIDWSPFDLADKAASQAHDGPMVTEEMVFKIAAYEAGEQSVPAVSFKVGGGPFSTDPLTVQITSTVGKAEAKNLQRRPDGEPLPIYEQLLWPFYVLGWALALAALYLLWKRRKPKAVAAAGDVKAQVAAHEAALMLFKMLRSKNYPQQGKFREYYFEATEILRAYFSQRYAINALDLTTNELMQKLSGISAPALEREALRTWLEHGDLVKFAKLKPTTEKAAEMIDFFEALVWATRPPAPKELEMAS